MNATQSAAGASSEQPDNALTPADPTYVDGDGNVLDRRAVCPRCYRTPGQMLGGSGGSVRYRCRHCQHRYIRAFDPPARRLGPRC